MLGIWSRPREFQFCTKSCVLIRPCQGVVVGPQNDPVAGEIHRFPVMLQLSVNRAVYGQSHPEQAENPQQLQAQPTVRQPSFFGQLGILGGIVGGPETIVTNRNQVYFRNHNDA
jgi:hypothetical protein